MNKLIIGHNVSFDRSKIVEEYSTASKNMFMDTMAMHNSTHGLNTDQRMLYLKKNFESIQQVDIFFYNNSRH